MAKRAMSRPNGRDGALVHRVGGRGTPVSDEETGQWV